MLYWLRWSGLHPALLTEFGVATQCRTGEQGMSDRSAANMQRLFDAVQNTRGETASSFRRAIEEQSAEIGIGAGGMGEALPGELANYVRKVAMNAYKVTDEDIESLRRAGYSEDAIFEITLCAAIGAGRVRLERGLAALKGEQLCD